MVFLSAPRGGPSYIQNPVFDLRTMITLDGFRVFRTAQIISHDICDFVPRNTDRNQLMELADGKHVEIEENMLDERVITITAYFGGLVRHVNLYMPD